MPAFVPNKRADFQRVVDVAVRIHVGEAQGQLALECFGQCGFHRDIVLRNFYPEATY